jgi:diacylglycerol kinase
MKGKCLLSRMRFALSGVTHAAQREASFRFQCVAGLVLLVAVLILRPPLLWSALLAMCVGLVLAAELINTALEATLDGLHPQQAEFVRVAKDCAAAAVLVLSLMSVVVFLIMLADILSFPLTL